MRTAHGTVFDIQSKGSIHNLVTEWDKRIEETLVTYIRSHYPSHNFLGEEGGDQRGSADEPLWIIDPIDGTVNFAHGIPIFTVSIGVAVGGKVVSGVVLQPMTQELFHAEKGKGAYLNGKRIEVSKTSTLEHAMFSVGFPYNVKDHFQTCVDHLAQFLRLGVPIRRLGSAALDLSYVAAGRLDGFWEITLQPWDVAAGLLIVEEAGGRVTHYDGSPRKLLENKSLLATNGKLHKQMVEKLK